VTLHRTTEPDMRIVDALCRGVQPERQVTTAELLAAIRYLSGQGYSDGQIGHLVRRSRRTVLRYRSAHGIRGLPFGSNGLTRPREFPLPARNHKK
jgi:hypothetical protein